MRRIINFFFILCLSIVFATCSTSKKTLDHNNTGKIVTEKEQYQATDLYILAIKERELGSLDKSLDLFNKASLINPTDGAIHYEKARTLSALNRNDEALAEAKIALETNPTNRWYKMLFADLSRLNENYDDYIAIYEEIYAESPNDLELIQEMAFAYYYTGNYAKAVKCYDKIEEAVGINESLSIQKVQLYDKLGETDSAIAEYEKLIGTDPDETRYYALLAEYCSKKKREEKAIWAYNKIVEINPDDPYIHISLADFYRKNGDNSRSFDELKIGLANPNLDLTTKINVLLNYYSGNLTEEQQKQALELSQILKATHPDDIIADTFYASMLFENKDYAQADSLFRAVLAQNKNNYVIWEKLLFCDLFLENNELLASDAEKVIDLFPTYPLPYYFGGIANFQLKNFEKALSFLNTGKDFVVNNNALLEQFYSSLGDNYHALGNFDAAYDSYDKALSINPDNAGVLNNYAYYLSLTSTDLSKAEKMAKKAVEIDPYNSNFLDTYAWVLYKLNKFDSALEWIKKAYANGGQNSGVVLEHYGDILYQLGNKEEALNYWKMAKNQKEYSDLLDKKINDKTLYEQ